MRIIEATYDIIKNYRLIKVIFWNNINFNYAKYILEKI